MSDAADPGGGPKVRFAKRRPDWELPDLHADLQLDSHEPLLAARAAGRLTCPKCTKSRWLYCYDCLLPLTAAPRLALPFHLSIITHQEESLSKNTGVQAAVLAPEHVTLHSLDHCPPFDPSRAVVLFPSPDALDAADLDPSSVDRAFIIDSRWKKARELLKHPALEGVRHVALKTAKTAFWRFHTKGVSDESVCTIECLYYFLSTMAQAGKLPDQPPRYWDNLLFYFVFQHRHIKEAAAKRFETKYGAGNDGNPAAAGAAAAATGDGKGDEQGGSGAARKAPAEAAASSKASDAAKATASGGDFNGGSGPAFVAAAEGPDAKKLRT